MQGGHNRRGPFLDEWCIIADNRGKRPDGHKAKKETDQQLPEYEPRCVFCPGNEVETPPEIWVYPQRSRDRANKPGWELRIVPNLYAAQTVEGGTQELLVGHHLIKGNRANGARGAHEVVIETPHHSRELHEQELSVVQRALLFYQGRLADLYKDPGMRQVTIFKNRGRNAGSSLPHPHSQIIATAMIPPAQRRVLEAARKYYSVNKRCRWCDDIAFYTMTGTELRDQSGGPVAFSFPRDTFLVASNEDFVAFAPFAPVCAWQVEILPKVHRHDFRKVDREYFPSLADILKTVLGLLEQALDDFQYNFFLRTTPNYEPEQDNGRVDKWSTLSRDFHWGISIQPVTNIFAGFEKATQMSILTIAPETWAEKLRSFE